MLISCKADDQKLLANCLGKRLEGLIAYKQPSIATYDLILLQFDNGWNLTLQLEAIDIAPKFEVFLIQVSQSKPYDALFGYDKFTLGDFQVKEIDIVRRLEWIEGEAFEPTHETDVDAGLFIRSSNGTELKIEADPFPLAFQLEFIAIGSGKLEKSQHQLIPVV